MQYAGLDIHKKTIFVAVKDQMGNILQQKKIKSQKHKIIKWAQNGLQPLSVLMEATLFTGWIYDLLLHYVAEITVANPVMLSSITKARNKNDKLDSKIQNWFESIRKQLPGKTRMQPQ